MYCSLSTTVRQSSKSIVHNLWAITITSCRPDDSHVQNEARADEVLHIPYTHVCLYYHSIEHKMSMEYGVWTMGRRSDSGGIFRRQQNDVLFTCVNQLGIDLLRV